MAPGVSSPTFVCFLTCQIAFREHSAICSAQCIILEGEDEKRERSFETVDLENTQYRKYYYKSYKSVSVALAHSRNIY